MACVSIPEENRELTNADEIREFLEPFGIWYEKWDCLLYTSPSPRD